ncbi:hypothetical protein TTHERM_00354590 (macronuclear) [Tetrahymena thermophila SB210]|uniref:Uncharacterized protein n=1 Tax=Tetrahymena thermophila (strain SB210) TaxID=312017 RepID=Q22YB1_TETTS|nr:hypothetical protein TTHERM_00354590 [Tetrahymena thermophila SB210]EAR90113.2 hypothetical protein TTHERM_00354590 [Tetrahymena thermophila SB210]|eukprot:XP_001010358.2 hypothetical protein TTHERM_00354590 [Tetrahymena thermophila SB210]
MQNLDKIRNNLNSKLQIQTELNAILIGGNSLSNLGLICNQGATGNIFSNNVGSTTHGNTPINNCQNSSFQNSNQTFKKVLSITPQYSSSNKINLFQSQNKQIQDLSQNQKKDSACSYSASQISAQSSQKLIQQQMQNGKKLQNKIDIENENNFLKNKNEEVEEQLHEDTDHQDGNADSNFIQHQVINSGVQRNNSALEGYSKNSQHHKQSDLDNLNLAATLIFEKLKKRDKNSNSAKGHPRNVHQSGLTSNASYSKSSLPSNNSTTVNHYQGNNSSSNNNNNNYNFNQQILGSNKNSIQPSQASQPQQRTAFLSNSINNFNSKNMFGLQQTNLNNNSNQVQSNSANQLSKTLSFTIQQYHQLMNHDTHQPYQQQQPQHSQNQFIKQIHQLVNNQQNEIHNSNSVNQSNITGSQQQGQSQPNFFNNTNLSGIKSPTQQLSNTQKHRKVASMSSSSPKYSKENMYIDCSKGSYNIVDVKKLFKGISPQTTSNFHLLSTNQINSNGAKQLKQLNSGEKGEANFCTPHNHQNQSVQNADNQNYLQIKVSKTPGNLSFNQKITNNCQNNEVSRDIEKSSHRSSEKSKNFLSKITNQGKNNNTKPAVQQQQLQAKKTQQKKSHKSQSCISVSTANPNHQKIAQNSLNQNKNQEEPKKIPQLSIQSGVGGGGTDLLIKQNKQIYQSQVNFQLLKQQLIEQHSSAKNQNDKQSQHQQNHVSCDDTTAVNSYTKDKISEKDQQHSKSSEQNLNLENAKISSKFDQILKQRIDQNSYSEIMEVFSQLSSSDIYFQSSLQKLKICLDSLMHDMNSKIKNLKIFAAKTQQLKKNVETINNEKKQLINKVNILQNENQQLLSNSTNVTNSNQSKTNNNINIPSDNYNNNINFNQNQKLLSSGQSPTNQVEFIAKTNQEETQQYKVQSLKQFNSPNEKQIEISRFQEKQTQTILKENDSTEKQKQNQQNNFQVTKEEIEEVYNENQILREYVVEQEKKLTAYKDKESSMIKLLLAIKKNGVDIDEIYERDVVNQIHSHKQQNLNNNNDDDEEDDEQEENDQGQVNNLVRSRYIENLKNGIIDQRNNSQFFGYADESIINDSDESSFNYYGKPQSLENSLLNQIDQLKYQSNANSGRSKIEDGIQKKLKLNLNEIKKIPTQTNEEAVQNNKNGNQVEEIYQKQQLQQQQINQLPCYENAHQKVEQNLLKNEFINNNSKGFINENIFIEQEYQECNFDQSQNKQLCNILEDINNINILDSSYS